MKNFWVGKKELSIDSLSLQKKGKNTFFYKTQDNQRKEILTKGNFLTGVASYIKCIWW